MDPFVAALNYWLALSGIALALFAGYVFLVQFILQDRSLAPVIRRFGLWIVLLVTLASATLTLLYSEIFGFIPCGLCWLQRVFLYPLPIVMAVALVRGVRERVVADIGITLASLGAFVALYQHYLQMGGTELVACPTAGVGADCARRILFEFGLVTFPLLSAIVFVFVIVVLLAWRREV